MFWQDNPLPRASLKTGHYETITGADSLALALLEVHAATHGLTNRIPVQHHRPMKSMLAKSFSTAASDRSRSSAHELSGSAAPNVRRLGDCISGTAAGVQGCCRPRLRFRHRRSCPSSIATRMQCWSTAVTLYGPAESGLFLSALDRAALAPLTNRPPAPAGIREGDRVGPQGRPAHRRQSATRRKSLAAALHAQRAFRASPSTVTLPTRN